MEVENFMDELNLSPIDYFMTVSSSTNIICFLPVWKDFAH